MAPTEKLYYQDAYRVAFDSPVLERGEERGRPFVVLERTCFYPEGGGQPADRGWLNDVPVVDVQSREGRIYHFLEVPIREEVVTGRIDWFRRYDFMQQHTGQHLISRSLEEVGGHSTVSVHLGEEYTSVELDTPQISSAVLNEAESLANRIIRENRPVTIHWVSPREASRFPLRKQPPQVEQVRIVEIQDFDYSPCGGTHVASTGELAVIQCVGQEKIRGRVRLIFRIGDRLLRDYRRKSRLLQELGQLLTSGEEELLQRVSDLQHQVKELQRQQNKLHTELMRYRAAEALNAAETIGTVRFVGTVFTETDPRQLKPFVDALLQEPGIVVAAFVRNGQELRFLIARSQNLPLDLKRMVPDLLPLIGGKGGGSPQLQQGGGNHPEGISQFLEQLKTKILQEQNL